ncbi:hypothetical protein PG990_011964 [Apiospora arundinis]
MKALSTYTGYPLSVDLARAPWCSNRTPYNVHGDPDTPFEISAIEHLVKDLVMLAQPTANGLCRDAGKMLDHAFKLGDKKR